MISTIVQGRIGAVMSRGADCRKNSVVVGGINGSAKRAEVSE